MNYSFDDAGAADTHTTQYFEMFVNRGIYHRGWTAAHPALDSPVMKQLPAIEDDVWELYEPDDWTQAHDQRKKIRRCWPPAAVVHHRGGEVQRAPTRRPQGGAFQLRPGRGPQLIRGNTQTLFGGMAGRSENSDRRDEEQIPRHYPPESRSRGGAHGTIVSMGGAFGGWSIYAKTGSQPIATTCSGCNSSRSTGTLSQWRPESIRSGLVRLRRWRPWQGLGTARLFVDRRGSMPPFLWRSLPERDHRRGHRHGHAGNR